MRQSHGCDCCNFFEISKHRNRTQMFSSDSMNVKRDTIEKKQLRISGKKHTKPDKRAQ